MLSTRAAAARRDHQELALAETAYLRQLIEHLRKNYRVRYRTIADALNIDRTQIYSITAERSAGARWIFTGVIKYYKESGYELPPKKADALKNGPKATLLGMDYFLKALDLDLDLIVRSEKSVSGKYLLFSYLHNKNIGITWFEFHKPSKRIPVPIFTARRPGPSGKHAIYEGFYYEYDSSLFLFGHMAKTPYARSLVLVPKVGNRRDRVGVILGSSPVDALFVSSCYLKRLPDSATRQSVDRTLGEREPPQLMNEFGEIVQYLEKRKDLTESVLRTGS